MAKKKFYEEDLLELEEQEKDEFDEEFGDLEQLYEASLRNVEEGAVVKGLVLRVTREGVMVDIGYKSEGIVPASEFTTDEIEALSAGDEINVFLEEREDSDGNVVLSKDKADKIKIWEQIAKAYDNNEVVEGKVVAKIKGGLTVDINGVKAFLPGSQIDLRPVRNLDSLQGQTLRMRILKMNQKRGNIVLSRRVLLEEERSKKKSDTLSTLSEGMLVKGTVKNITEYGAFIDLGGIDGLLYITDMSWGRISHPSELLMVGDQIEVMVLKFDRDNERVSLGLKQKSADPWTQVEQKYAVGTRIKGKVVSLTEYGAFVQLEEGVEGLVHVSEMSWTQKVKHPSKVVEVGDIIEAVVLNVDRSSRRISLGMKQIESNPWASIAERYPVGLKVEGKVRNLTDFGAFVGLEEGIDGLIHISDMSWTKHLKHPSELLKKGQSVEAVVLSVDADKERISLGLKQLETDPWEGTIPSRYQVGSDASGTVVKVTDFGVFVELEDGVEGLIHISELAKDPAKKIEDSVAIGDSISARIIKVDSADRKIGLSVRAQQRGSERDELDEYRRSQEKPDQSLGAVAKKSSRS
ncbi:MAG: 30S ribosomal protein S1 [Nitrospirota bacterium]|nr:30S ribosomal protein S1 [Nitrospirota bacterium]